MRISDEYRERRCCDLSAQQRREQILWAVLAVLALVLAAHADWHYYKHETAHERTKHEPPRSLIRETSLEATSASLTADTQSLRTSTRLQPDKRPRSDSARSYASGPWRTAKVSVYGDGDGFLGRRTASGQVLDSTSLTFAHKHMPFGTRVTFRYEGRTVTARCNDRGPYIAGREFDLAPATRRALGMGITIAEVQWRYADSSK